MKWGTFIAVDKVTRNVRGANTVQMVMEEYMVLAKIADSQEVIGPFEIIITDRNESAHSWTDKHLHEEALRMARAEQKKIATKLQAEHTGAPMSLAEHCSRESGHPIGSVALTKYINRHYGHG